MAAVLRRLPRRLRAVGVVARLRPSRFPGLPLPGPRIGRVFGAVTVAPYNCLASNGGIPSNRENYHNLIADSCNFTISSDYRTSVHFVFRACTWVAPGRRGAGRTALWVGQAGPARFSCPWGRRSSCSRPGLACTCARQLDGSRLPCGQALTLRGGPYPCAARPPATARQPVPHGEWRRSRLLRSGPRSGGPAPTRRRSPPATAHNPPVRPGPARSAAGGGCSPRSRPRPPARAAALVASARCAAARTPGSNITIR